jgi:integrase
VMFQRRRSAKSTVGGTWYIELALPTGTVRWSTGTSDRSTAAAVERALRDLIHRREWDLLDAVRSHAITLGELFDAHRHRDLDGLRAKLNDTNLEPKVEEWLEVHKARVSVDTINHYRIVVRRLMLAGVPFPASRFSVKTLEPWIAKYSVRQNRKKKKEDQTHKSAGNETRRKAHAALSVFAEYLMRQGVISLNPMRQFPPAPSNAPRLQYLEVERMIALADEQPEPYQSLSAFLHGTGADLSTALAITAADVDLQRKEVRAAGTKTHARDRIVRVAEWAWPYIVARVAQLEPGARLFAVDRWEARDVHVAACKSLGIVNYWLRDARHSYAVRAARAGTPSELIAKQLGHVDATMVLRVYARFMSEQADRDRWEMRAAELDQERWKDLADRGISVGSVPFPVPTAPKPLSPQNKKPSNPFGSEDLENSWGGTRTHDPGIMSAVL